MDRAFDYSISGYFDEKEVKKYMPQNIEERYAYIGRLYIKVADAIVKRKEKKCVIS